MIPLRDDNPSSTAPIVTIVLIVLNVVVYLLEMAIGLDRATWLFGLIPAELTAHIHVPVTVEGAYNLQPSWLTIFTSMFMHGSILHIRSNMWVLWIFGNNVEDAMGKVKFLLFYLFSGVCGAAAQVVLSHSST